jgi:hypothetical protein
MTVPRRFWIPIVLIAAFSVQPALGFNEPLSPEAIRDAYFLGVGDATKRAEVFAKYTRTLPTPAKGPFVASIEFETPYMAVADQISQRIGSYYPPDAEQDFLGKPAICHVIVQVYFPYDDYNNFTVQLTQRGKQVQSLSRHGTFLYTDDEGNAAVGIQMDVKYAADRIETDESAMVQVSIDDGPKESASFDLSSLK